MEFYIDDEDFGKCRKHPSQPRHGVCAACLRDRLTVLCPDCARLRPCACCSFSDFTSSASSSSSLDAAATGSGGVGGAPMSFLIDREPPLFRRSKSVAFSFLRPKTGETSTSSSSSFARRPPPPENPTKSSSSFWSFLKSDKPKKKPDPEQDSSSTKKKTATKKAGNFPRSKSVRYPRSRSVGASCYSDMGEVSGGLKGWGWYFPSPMKVFLHPKTGKVARERSPLCRG